MGKSAPWTTSVDELIRLFRDALVALVPIAERARMSWREPDAYDDWDQICQAIYRSIVIGSIEFTRDIPNMLPIPQYDDRIASYKETSFITDAVSAGELAFICFETAAAPFDRCLFAVLNDGGQIVGYQRKPTADLRFVLARRDTTTTTYVDGVQVRL
jgi:hypothetical protein